MTVREIAQRDRAEWVRMRDALWPGFLADHEAETRTFFEQRRSPAAVWIAEADGQVVGFLELEYRSYAEGCTSSPVPYIEGWYVDPSRRGQGIGRALVRAAEAHAFAAGHREIASDAQIDNTASIAAHGALGYEEVDRIVCFRRALSDA
jgi:aminoglycoside 6'-N-acetyltransferase I